MRSYFRQRRRELLYGLARRIVFAVCRDTVIAGPFAGMTFPSGWRGAVAPAYLLGLYEREIHGFLTGLSSVPLDRIVNVGAAEGYYAVGLARMWPQARVSAFEAGAEARERMRAVAARNGVADRIDAGGFCAAPEFAQALAAGTRPFVVMDIEGGEDELLRIDRFPALARAHVLVETHDHVVPGGCARIEREFAATHHVQTIWSVRREAADLPRRFPRILHKWLLHVGSDQRGAPGQQAWVCLSPRDRSETPAES